MFKFRSAKQQRLLVAFGITESAVQLAILKAVNDSEAAGAALKHAGKTWQLVVNDEVEIGSGNTLGAIAALLERYKRFDFQGQPLQIVLSSSLVEQVAVDKPDVPAQDIAPTLQWTLKDLVSIPAADLLLDYYDIPVQVAGAKKVNVVAVSRNKVQPWVLALSDAGFAIQGIVNQDLAFIHWADADLRTMIISQVPGERPQLQIIVRQQLILSRRLPGSYNLEKIDPQDLDTMESLAIELQRSQDFYTGQLRQAPLADIELAFNHAHSDKVAEVIAAQLGMQVSALAYPGWAKDLAAGDYSDAAGISGLLWLLAEQALGEKKGDAT
ncbi:MAG: hypothetical protein LAT53_06390 [Idiomarina sp.]|nr:hypothetical protein [Idiomarina sp.]